jgi:hypothetical protein
MTLQDFEEFVGAFDESKIERLLVKKLKLIKPLGNPISWITFCVSNLHIPLPRLVFINWPELR